MPQPAGENGTAAAPSWSDVLRVDIQARILITFICLCLYRLGAQIPAPGLDLNVLALSTSDASGLAVATRERLSIFALGLVPILSAMILGEVLKLLVPGLRATLAASETTRTAYNRAIIVTGLLFAAFQGYGIALALEAIEFGGDRLVGEPGGGFRSVIAITLVAATALLVWLADMITRYGLGGGFWIILLFPSVRSLAELPSFLLSGVGEGVIASHHAVATVAALIAIVAVLSTLYRARLPAAAAEASTPNFEEPLRGRVLTAWVWPPLIAATVVSYLPVLSWIVSGRDDASFTQSIFAYGRPGELAAVALLTVLATLILSPRGLGEAGRAAARITAITLAIIVLVMTLITVHVPITIPDGSWLIASVVVCLMILPDRLSQLFPDGKPLTIDPAG